MSTHAVIGLALLLALAPSATAEQLEGTVLANGGTSRASGGGYELAGTIAQPASGRASAGALVLDAGFWHPRATPTGTSIFRNGFED